jgi:hypothetical protein
MYLKVKYKNSTTTELIREGTDTLSAFPGFKTLAHNCPNFTTLTALGTAMYLRNKDATNYVVVTLLFIAGYYGPRYFAKNR